MADSSRTSVFVSYSHYDREWLERLQVHLKPLQREGVIDYWDDTRIMTGQRWDEEIKRALSAARVAVLLVSADFLASDYIADEELSYLMAAHAEEGLALMPVIVKPCRLKHVPFLADFQAANPGMRPLADMNEGEREAVWTKLAEDIDRLLDGPVVADESKDSDVPPAALWNVPYELNTFFTGRDDVLARVGMALETTGRAALCGLGGIGKTQTALMYAHVRRSDYHAVFWTGAETETALTSGFLEIARLLGLPEAREAEQARAVGAVKRWLESNDDWLLVFDNADTPQLVKPFRPNNPRGHVLLTSRTQVLHTLGIAATIELEKMTPAEAVRFLGVRTGRNNDPLEQQAATELARELGYLPLALEQAGAYITANRSRFQDYMKSYRRRRLNVLHLPVAGEYPETVATTWAINFAEVEQRPESAELLRLSAFLSPDNIPLELITRGAPVLGPVFGDALKQVDEDPLVLDEILEPLTRYSLVCRDIATQTYSIHRIMQAVLIDGMDADAQVEWARRTVLALDRAFPSPDFANWLLCERLLPHVQAAADLIHRKACDGSEAAGLLTRGGLYLKQRAHYAEAELLITQSMTLRQALLGPSHPEVALCMFHIATFQYYQGHYQEAERVARQVLTLQEAALAPDDPDLASTLNFLGVLCSSQRGQAEAEPWFQRALSAWESSLGPDHPSVAKALNNLAELHDSLGSHDNAEAMCRRSLNIRERILGVDHPDTARTVHNLAAILDHQGRTAEAEEAYLRAIRVRENALGLEHPHLAESLGSYAAFLRSEERLVEAKELDERADAIRAESARSRG